ncbi:MAG TPA: DUF2939 domain-containing protein [Longimicrobiaceae bacterium]|nr:DUF2939 domain-containing protein [Longimicrobiaceae bacterium]
MSKRRNRLVPFLALALCLGAAYLYFSPYIAFARLKSAAQKGDEQALSALVDFPAVRASVTGEVSGAVSSRLSFGGRARGLGNVAGALAGALSSNVVNALVTPQGIAGVVKGARSAREAARGDGDASDDGDKPRHDSPVKTSQGYEGPNTFVVHLAEKESGKERAALVLTRQGLASWRMTGVRFGGGHRD